MERASRLVSKLSFSKGAISPEDLVRAAWPEAVGKRIAGHARGASLTGKRLVVEVEDAVWQRQLAVLVKQILGRLEEVLGRSLVSEIEFRVTPRRRQPRIAESPRQAGDESDQILDPVLRTIYRQKRPRRSA
jgi:predicted nucleic acid-binding Zn ribbon protein